MSDLFKILSVVGAYEYAGGGQSFCEQHFVRHKVRDRILFSLSILTYMLQAMEEIHKLRAQISNIVHTNFADTDAGFIPKLPPPQDIQVARCQIVVQVGLKLTVHVLSVAQGSPPTAHVVFYRSSRRAQGVG